MGYDNNNSWCSFCGCVASAHWCAARVTPTVGAPLWVCCKDVLYECVARVTATVGAVCVGVLQVCIGVVRVIATVVS